jgi:glutathione S-transferase
MNLFFSPLACSLASRIALYETQAPARFSQVDLKQKHVIGGGDFRAINAMGQVPALQLDDGTVITENTAVLQFIAAKAPEKNLAPVDTTARAQLQQWLGFIATELHKAVFVPLLDRQASDAVKEYARDKVANRLGVLEKHLSGREYLLEAFSIADAYLATILNWASATNVDLKQWPAVHAYHQRMLQRPTIARAVAEEFAMYREEQARQKA